MLVQPDLSKLSVRQFAERFRGEMIPLSKTISYYCGSTPLSEEDLKEYLEEPVAALPPGIAASLPKISILLVPYLERAAGHEKKKTEPAADADSQNYVSTERPPDSRSSTSTQLKLGDETVLAFVLKNQEVAEYHYRFYHLLATLLSEHWEETAETKYMRLLREETTADVHGEVDEPSWRMKQTLRRAKDARTGGVRNNKAFREYARQSFADTLTLYLHGLCCDIDVDTGPRQLPSRYLRKRLILLEELYPPPTGYAVFPEQLEA